jgi:hypothetical protein
MRRYARGRLPAVTDSRGSPRVRNGWKAAIGAMSAKTYIALENTADKGLFAPREDLMRGLEIGFAVVGIYITIKLFIGAMLDPAYTVKERPRRIKSMVTGASPSHVLKAIVASVPVSIYKIELFDETNSNIVLGEAPSLTSYGFFYPVFVRSEGAETRVEVGIKSKGWQVGPCRLPSATAPRSLLVVHTPRPFQSALAVDAAVEALAVEALRGGNAQHHPFPSTRRSDLFRPRSHRNSCDSVRLLTFQLS